MSAIFVLYENTHDHIDEAVCWHDDRAVLEAEAERREWEHYRAKKGRQMPTGPIYMSPDECEYRRFTVGEIERFVPPEHKGDGI